MRSTENGMSAGIARRRRPRQANTVSAARLTTAPTSTESSNATITYGGMDRMALPPVTSGHASDVPIHSAKPASVPVAAADSVTRPSRLGGRPSASRISGNAAGMETRRSCAPRDRSSRTACAARAGSLNMARRPRSFAMSDLLFHLGDRHRRQNAHEQEEPEEEPAERSEGDAP